MKYDPSYPYNHRVSVSKDLILCCTALTYFYDTTYSYVSLTNLALVTREALSDVNSIIPSTMDILFLYIIENMITKRIGHAALQDMQIAEKDERLLFLETIYSCLFMLVKRCMGCLGSFQ